MWRKKEFLIRNTVVNRIQALSEKTQIVIQTSLPENTAWFLPVQCQAGFTNLGEDSIQLVYPTPSRQTYDSHPDNYKYARKYKSLI